MKQIVAKKQRARYLCFFIHDVSAVIAKTEDDFSMSKNWHGFCFNIVDDKLKNYNKTFKLSLEERWL